MISCQAIKLYSCHLTSPWSIQKQTLPVYFVLALVSLWVSQQVRQQMSTLTHSWK